MYKIRIEGKKAKTKNDVSLTLYQACLKIEGVHGGIIVCSGKLIAFYCSYHNKIKVGFGANEYERQQVLNFYK